MIALADTPPLPLAAASQWLESWRRTGGGTTIACDGTITVWWMPAGTSEAHADQQLLLSQIGDSESTRTAVKALVHAEALVRKGLAA